MFDPIVSLLREEKESHRITKTKIVKRWVCHIWARVPSDYNTIIQNPILYDERSPTAQLSLLCKDFQQQRPVPAAISLQILKIKEHQLQLWVLQNKPLLLQLLDDYKPNPQTAPPATDHLQTKSSNSSSYCLSTNRIFSSSSSSSCHPTQLQPHPTN